MLSSGLSVFQLLWLFSDFIVSQLLTNLLISVFSGVLFFDKVFVNKVLSLAPRMLSVNSGWVLSWVPFATGVLVKACLGSFSS